MKLNWIRRKLKSESIVKSGIVTLRALWEEQWCLNERVTEFRKWWWCEDNDVEERRKLSAMLMPHIFMQLQVQPDSARYCVITVASVA